MSGLFWVLLEDFALVISESFESDGVGGIEPNDSRTGSGFALQSDVLLGPDGDDRPAEGSCDDDPDEECSYRHGSILSSDDGLLAQSMPTMSRMEKNDERIPISSADRDDL